MQRSLQASSSIASKLWRRTRQISLQQQFLVSESGWKEPRPTSARISTSEEKCETKQLAPEAMLDPQVVLIGRRSIRPNDRNASDVDRRVSLTVTFTPSVKGKRTASVSVSDNGGGSPQKVGLAGKGT